MAKVLLYVMLVLLNVIMEPSNVKKKIRELLNVTKVLPNVRNVWFNVILVLPYVTMVPSNVRKK